MGLNVLLPGCCYDSGSSAKTPSINPLSHQLINSPIPLTNRSIHQPANYQPTQATLPIPDLPPPQLTYSPTHPTHISTQPMYPPVPCTFPPHVPTPPMYPPIPPTHPTHPTHPIHYSTQSTTLPNPRHPTHRPIDLPK